MSEAIETRQLFTKSPFNFEIRKKMLQPGLDDVLVKVKACGICGTDYHFAKDGAGDFIPLGHEVSGIVEKVGDNVTRFKPGDNVVAENHTLCGVCEKCKDGLSVHCRNIKTYQGVEAGLADYILLHHTMLNKFTGLNFTEASMAEPLTVALDIVEATDIPLNSSVAIFGAGTIGLLILQVVKLLGASDILLVDKSLDDKSSRYKLELGKKLGASDIAGYDSPDFYDVIKDKYPDGLDRVIITSPPNTLEGAINISKFGGVIGLIGVVFGKDRLVSFDMNEFHFKRLELRCIHAIPNLRFPMALDLIKRKKIDVNSLITHKVNFEDYEQAFNIFKDAQAESVKIVVIV